MKKQVTLNAAVAAFVSSFLVSCGGDGGSDNTALNTQPAQQNGTPAPTQTTTPEPAPSVVGQQGGQPAPAQTQTTSPPAPVRLSAMVVRAPVDGEVVSGRVRLEVQGTSIANVELLPSESFLPRLGVFTVSPDGTSAFLDLDTTNVPNGLLHLRISAFDAAANTSGAKEAIAMPSRTWTFHNEPPPFGSAAGRAARCQVMGMPFTSLDDPQPVVCVRFQVTSPSDPPEACTGGFDTPYANPEDALPVLRDGRRISKLYCEPGANNGVVNPGCECVS